MNSPAREDFVRRTHAIISGRLFSRWSSNRGVCSWGCIVLPTLLVFSGCGSGQSSQVPPPLQLELVPVGTGLTNSLDIQALVEPAGAPSGLLFAVEPGLRRRLIK